MLCTHSLVTYTTNQALWFSAEKVLWELSTAGVQPFYSVKHSNTKSQTPSVKPSGRGRCHAIYRETGVSVLHWDYCHAQGMQRGCTRRKHYKVLVSTNELWSRAWRTKWPGRFKNSILVFPNHCFSRILNLNGMVSLNIQKLILHVWKDGTFNPLAPGFESCLIPLYICT